MYDAEQAKDISPSCNRMFVDRPTMNYKGFQKIARSSPETPEFSCGNQTATLLWRFGNYLFPSFLGSKKGSWCPMFRSGGHNADCNHVNGTESQKLQPRKTCKLWTLGVGKWIIGFLPFISIMRKYDIKNWLLSDIFAGLSVGIMHVPQGMAYALLARLTPVYGLYTSFFPSLIYFFFGTSRHISMGTIAVVSLLTGEVLDKIILIHELRLAEGTTDMIKLNATEALVIKASYVPVLTFGVGLVQLVMGFLHLGGLTRYMSEPMTSGFTVGVSVHVFTSQIKPALGLHFEKPRGLFTIPMTIYRTFENILSVNVVTFGLAMACVIILVIFKELINPRIIKKTKVPIPIELFVVIISTIVSFGLSLKSKYNVQVIEEVPTGIPTPVFPDVSKMGEIIGDIFVIAIVAFSVCISLARIFATTLEYSIEFNQELLAYGLTNTISSFFHTYPAASSLARSAVQVSAGGKTQLVALISSTLLIFCLFFIGPLLYHVPNCCLSAIILVALKGMFLQSKDLAKLWNYCLWDAGIWLITFLCTALVDVKYGLLTGVVISMLVIIIRTQSPMARLLGQIKTTEIYEDVDKHENCLTSELIKVVRFEGSLYYACADHFRQTVYKSTGVNPVYLKHKLKKIRKRLKRLCLQLNDSRNLGELLNYEPNETSALSELLPDDTEEDEVCLKEERTSDDFAISFDTITSITNSVEIKNGIQSKLEDLRERLLQSYLMMQAELAVQHIILDCSCWNIVDTVGANELNLLIEDYAQLDVTISLAQLKSNILKALYRGNKLPQTVQVFPTIHDAVLTVGRNLVDTKTRLSDLLNGFQPEPNQSTSISKSSDDAESGDQANCIS